MFKKKKKQAQMVNERLARLENYMNFPPFATLLETMEKNQIDLMNMQTMLRIAVRELKEVE